MLKEQKWQIYNLSRYHKKIQIEKEYRVRINRNVLWECLYREK